MENGQPQEFDRAAASNYLISERGYGVPGLRSRGAVT